MDIPFFSLNEVSALNLLANISVDARFFEGLENLARRTPGRLACF